MNRPDLYFRNAEIISNAFRNNTIHYRSNARCYVANLIAGNMGYTVHTTESWDHRECWYKGDTKVNHDYWPRLLHGSKLFNKIKLLKDIGLRQYKLQKKHLAATGYTNVELKKIEKAFERCYELFAREQNILKGVEAAFAVLRDIHQITIEDRAMNIEQNNVTALIDRLVNRHQSVNFHFIHKTDAESEKSRSQTLIN